VSLTDPYSRAMAAHTKVGVGYNIQIAVDAKHKMIVEQAVSKATWRNNRIKVRLGPGLRISGFPRMSMMSITDG